MPLISLIIIIGCSHKNASVSERERLAKHINYFTQKLATWKANQQISEYLILNTCCRFEVYMVLKVGHAYMNQQLSALFTASHIALTDENLYHKSGTEAVRHLFAVATSLDSIVVGENQILHQIKKAYSQATSKSTGSFLHKLFQSALSTGKLARTKTQIGFGVLSIPHVVLQLTKQHLAKHQQKDDSNLPIILVIGMGDIANDVMHTLRNVKARLLVTNRTPLSKKNTTNQKHFPSYGYTFIPFALRHQYAAEANVIITATTSSTWLIKKQSLQKYFLSSQAKNSSVRKQKLLIDLSLPRNIEPTITTVNNTNFFLYGLDDIADFIHHNKQDRYAEIEAVQQIIEQKVKNFEHQLKKQTLIQHFPHNLPSNFNVKPLVLWKSELKLK